MDRRRFLSIGALAPLAGLIGCEGREPLLRVSGITWVGFEPLFLAREWKLLPPDRVRLIDSPSNTNTLMQLAAGEVEAATLTLDEFILARAGGIPVRAALIFDTSRGADVLMSRPDITTVEQLAGKRVGVEETAAGALMLRRSLETAGLIPKDVTRVPLLGGEHLAAYRSGQVDALISYEPNATRLEAVGAHRLHDSSAFPGLIVDVLAVHERAIDRQPRTLALLLKAHFEALGVLRANPGRAHETIAPHLGLTTEETHRAFQGIELFDLRKNQEWLDPPARPFQEVAGEVAGIMLVNALIDEIPRFDSVTTARFLPEGP
ncbi:ABC transporter substrate-binding protein [Guyparkeria hydrothermalis]|uniref:ABC transporter substrate-binding protein n=1 Tax=Guyparkeria hydrothermalis TaxID=923 RepID=UPI0020211C33|nr:ABC transporter substrate-binding protein [Guyparkeria hydrothermalis]MCL7743745.1 ABC transporter substrate-binding protein [Guyparkeria hydrothermalis]